MERTVLRTVIEEKGYTRSLHPIVHNFYGTPAEIPLPGGDKLKDKVALVTGGFPSLITAHGNIKWLIVSCK